MVLKEIGDVWNDDNINLDINDSGDGDDNVDEGINCDLLCMLKYSQKHLLLLLLLILIIIILYI